MKDEAFKSRTRRCLSKMIKGISVVMLMFLASVIETDLLGQAEGSSVKLVHEKDLVIGGQSAAITWSPDSESLAFVRWGPGVAAIIDVETGALTEVPESQLNGMSTIAWSLDARLLAVSALSEFKVIDLTDHKSTLIHRYTESKDLGFEHASAFRRMARHCFFKGREKSLRFYIKSMSVVEM
jgi:hypothetical protein